MVSYQLIVLLVKIIYVSGNDERILLTALLDNLGKGASGAAIECMNIALGLDSTKGLNL